MRRRRSKTSQSTNHHPTNATDSLEMQRVVMKIPNQTLLGAIMLNAIFIIAYISSATYIAHATNITYQDSVRSFPNNEPQINYHHLRNFVQLGNTTSSNGQRSIVRVNNQHYAQNQAFNRWNNQSSDLSLINYNPSENYSYKGLFNKICMGTSNRLSSQGNRTEHYHHMYERFKNCTYVIGNLEITWLERRPDGKPLDLSFLEDIREITGYLLISSNKLDHIKLPNLQIIRGRELFKLSKGQDEYAMFVYSNEIETLEVPNLREILAGNFGAYSNNNLCYIKSIQFDEILAGPKPKVMVQYDSEPECPRCDDSCYGSCWGPGPDLCQKFSKTSCSPQCSQGRCFGTEPRQCCHLFCAGGCTGPKPTDCLACKNFYNDGECIQECPPMQRYNPTTFGWDPNPDGRYAFGATCVKECPTHLLRDNGACVRACPPNKHSVDGECVQCSGVCPKNCQGVEVIHSGNIENFVNCTIIEGSISIQDRSLAGFAEFYPNNSLKARHEPMDISMLEILSSVREITGFVSIQASRSDFKNLSFLRNLQTIRGRQTTDQFHALHIIKTSLVSLNLRSLKQVESGKVLIGGNKDLCYANTINFSRIAVGEFYVRGNAEPSECISARHSCNDQCGDDGCWGSASNECLSCKKYKVDDYCVSNCTSTINLGFLSYDAGNQTCNKCHPECQGGCTGTKASDCVRCKNTKDGPFCVDKCPIHKYNNRGVCDDCSKTCVDGCSGPLSKPGEGGCNLCGKIVLHSNQSIQATCIGADEPCPTSYYQEYLAPQERGPLKSSQARPVCRKCHNRCKSCSAMGIHKSICECAKYVADETCEDECPRDYYPDNSTNRCMRCSSQCNGCFGPTGADCMSCKVYRVYLDSHITSSSDKDTIELRQQKSENQFRFNCTSQCPPDKPYRISEGNMLDPFCSDTFGPDGDDSRAWISWPSVFLVFSIALASISCCLYYYISRIREDKKLELTKRLSGIDDVEPLRKSNLKPNLAPLLSIKETELRIGKVLGSGFGGTVYLGSWYVNGCEEKDPRPVAIKVLRENGQANIHREFLEEAYIMASVNHPNLVKLLAVCMTPKDLMLVTELMPLGCLLDYVSAHREEILPEELMGWCMQIAKGMNYLEEHRMVHRDLALRNVLLQKRGKALISDFGLAKLLELDQQEYKSGGGRLPVKWLAPECINERRFTHKSDVWAFGVTLWELLTFGAKPFEEYETNHVHAAIEQGDRLKQPRHLSTEVYKAMMSCWFYNPEDRPNFKSLCKTFARFTEDPTRFIAQELYQKKRLEFGRNSDSDDVGFEEASLDANSMGDEVTLPRSAQSEVLQTNMNHGNMFAFDQRFHPEFETGHNSQTVMTPTFRKIPNHLMPDLINCDVFPGSPRIVNAMSESPLIDPNNNMSLATNSRLTMNADSCGSMHHTVSTNSLGLRSEQPTDKDEYLEPSYSTNEEKFDNMLAIRGTTHIKPPLTPRLPRDPPHSAGPYGVNNDEYFLTRMSHFNPGTPHGGNNASISHMPQSLV